MRNHYQTLGLLPEASAEDIRKAYRFFASKFHPDKHDGDKFFEEKFKEIQEANNVLSNQESRKHYDLSILAKSGKVENTTIVNERPEQKPTKEDLSKTAVKEGAVSPFVKSMGIGVVTGIILGLIFQVGGVGDGFAPGFCCGFCLGGFIIGPFFAYT